jgi:hypothetical protein
MTSPWNARKGAALLDRVSWTAAGTWVAAAAVCCVGGVIRGQGWIYGAGFFVAGFSVLLFIATTVWLSSTVFRGHRPARELRRALALWWGEPARWEKALVILAIGLGLCVTIVGILGSPVHTDLIQRDGAFMLVADAGTTEISHEAFDSFTYSRYVQGVLGPAMAIDGFVYLITKAVVFALVQPA